MKLGGNARAQLSSLRDEGFFGVWRWMARSDGFTIGQRTIRRVEIGMANVFIGGAWPYANGSLHMGRLASVLPGDVLARYFRLKGDRVLYVSGSDCHGTPVAVQAMQEGVEPGDIASRYHEEFAACFAQLGFTYDLYTRTDQPFHHRVVQELFLALLTNGHLYRKTTLQNVLRATALPARPVRGGHLPGMRQSRARRSMRLLFHPAGTVRSDRQRLQAVRQSAGGAETEHFYLALSRFQDALAGYAGQAEGWKDNAKQLTKRYLDEGLQDRAATRDLTWGVEVPVEGFEGKKIYVWIEAVSGYLSASKQWGEQTGGDWVVLLGRQGGTDHRPITCTGRTTLRSIH